MTMKRIIVPAAAVSAADYDAIRPREEGEDPPGPCSLACAKLWHEPTHGEVVDYFAETAPPEAIVVIGDGIRQVPDGFVFSHQFVGYEG